MPDAPYTKKRAAQFRGPTTSDDYNKRIEENYNDLVVLFNRARLSEVEQEELYRRMAKNQVSISRAIADLEQRVTSLEDATTRFTFFSEDSLSYFSELEGEAGLDSYFIPEDQRLSYSGKYGILTMSKNEGGSISKLRFTDSDGNEVVPPGLEVNILGSATTADNSGNVIDSSSPNFAFYRKAGLIWERNVITDAPDPDGAELTLYVKVPTDLFTTDKSNSLVIDAFPMYGATIRSVEFSTKPDPLLAEVDNYTPINSTAMYEGEAGAVGWVAPGGWTGADEGDDAIVNSGPKNFIFPPQTITAIKIVLHQSEWYKEGSKYIYSYGLSHLDLRYDKFNNFDDGSSAYVLFEAPSGQTISSVDAVTPEIYNVSPSKINDVFDYEVIWETYAGSGIPTTTPVANSERVWIKVTLKDTNGWSPALSGMTVNYS